MTDRNLFTMIRRQCPADAGKAFLESPDGSVLTYGDMLEHSGAIAQTLRHLGVHPGDRVAVQVEKSTDALLLYLATLRAGAVFLPLNTAYTPAEVSYFLGDAEAALFVCRPKDREHLGPLATAAGVTRIETLGEAGEGTLLAALTDSGGVGVDVARDADDLAALLYTSGTTGRSKGAMLTHGNLVSNASVLSEAWRFSAGDVLLHALPIFHVHGLFVATNVALMAGASMLFLPRFDLDDIIRLLPRATVMMGVPTFYTRLLGRADFTLALVGHMRLFVAGSAPLSAETFREFQERSGHAILERYGMTETGMNTANPYDGDRVPGSVGVPLPGVEIRIAQPDSGDPLPTGEVGVIEIRGPNVFKGYWQMPEKTAAEFRADGFFISGDLGYRDERGYVYIVGRGKDLIISGGYNVYPKEVEQALEALPGVAEAAVVGVPHPDLGEGVVGVVVPRTGAEPDERALLGALAQVLAGYKRPKRIVTVPALPRNSMGKILKNELRETYGALFR